jgi:hypothetical protein
MHLLVCHGTCLKCTHEVKVSRIWVWEGVLGVVAFRGLVDGKGKISLSILRAV